MAQQISVCIIAKNEEKYIETCLQALKPFDVEIVVVDTGSTDRTKEIAAKYTDSLYDFEWIGDFSAARNYAAKVAKHDYIVMIDCDEFAEKINISEVCKFLKKNPTCLGSLVQKSLVNSGSGVAKFNENVGRIYDRRFVKYVNRIHEQLSRIDGAEGVYHVFDVSVMHMGYMLSKEDTYKKNMRNIELLEKQAEEMPISVYTYFQLGQSYYVINEKEKAYEARKKAMELNPPEKEEFTYLLLAGFARSALEAGDYEEALRIEKYYEYARVCADYMFNLGQVYYANGKIEEALKTFELATKCTDCHADGMNTYFPYNAMSLLYEKLGENEKAQEYKSMAEDALRKSFNLNKPQ